MSFLNNVSPFTCRFAVNYGRLVIVVYITPKVINGLHQVRFRTHVQISSFRFEVSDLFSFVTIILHIKSPPNNPSLQLPLFQIYLRYSSSLQIAFTKASPSHDTPYVQRPSLRAVRQAANHNYHRPWPSLLSLSRNILYNMFL